MSNGNNGKANRQLTPGTKVVHIEDGEAGRIERICTYRRNGTDAWSYRVRLASGGGSEVWEAGQIAVLDDAA